MRLADARLCRLVSAQVVHPDSEWGRTSLADAAAARANKGPSTGKAAAALLADAKAKTAAAKRAVRTAMAVFKSAGCDGGSLAAVRSFSISGLQGLPGCQLTVTALDVSKAQAAAAKAKLVADQAQERAEVATGWPAGDPVSAVGYDTGTSIPAGYPLATSSNLGNLAARTKAVKPALPGPTRRRKVKASSGALAAFAPVSQTSFVTGVVRASARGGLGSRGLRAKGGLSYSSRNRYPAAAGAASGLWEERDRAAGLTGLVEAETAPLAFRQWAGRVGLGAGGSDRHVQRADPDVSRRKQGLL